jgi:uncharacterized membrane protein
VIAAGVAAWVTSYRESEREPWWKWVGAWLLYLALVAGYLTVAFGPSSWLTR